MIHVCSLAKLHETVEQTGARHVITLINGDTVLTRPSNVDPTNHLFLGINDIAEESARLSPARSLEAAGRDGQRLFIVPNSWLILLGDARAHRTHLNTRKPI